VRSLTYTAATKGRRVEEVEHKVLRRQDGISFDGSVSLMEGGEEVLGGWLPVAFLQVPLLRLLLKGHSVGKGCEGKEERGSDEHGCDEKENWFKTEAFLYAGYRGVPCETASR